MMRLQEEKAPSREERRCVKQLGERQGFFSTNLTFIETLYLEEKSWSHHLMSSLEARVRAM